MICPARDGCYLYEWRSTNGTSGHVAGVLSHFLASLGPFFLPVPSCSNEHRSLAIE